MGIAFGRAVHLDFLFHGFDSTDEWDSRLLASFKGIWLGGTLTPNMSLFEHFHPSIPIAYTNLYTLHGTRRAFREPGNIPAISELRLEENGELMLLSAWHIGCTLEIQSVTRKRLWNFD